MEPGLAKRWSLGWEEGSGDEADVYTGFDAWHIALAT